MKISSFIGWLNIFFFVFTTTRAQRVLMQMNPVVLLHTLVMSHFLLFPEKMSSLLPHLTSFYSKHVPFAFYSLPSHRFFLSSPLSLLFICAKFMSPLDPLILTLFYYAILFTLSPFLMPFPLLLALKSLLNRSIGHPFRALSASY